MTIGKRIKYFRTRNGLKQKDLGEALGFTDKTADVRLAQYEAEARFPKDDLIQKMSDIFGISSHALTVPDIDSNIGFMHTLFALEDMYGFTIDEKDGDICLRLNDDSDTSMVKMLQAWRNQADKFESGEITKEEYDKWRYKYPELDSSGQWKKTPTKKVSDEMVKAFEDKIK